MWELDARVLVDQLLVKLAEGFVLLFHLPSFLVIERDLNHILCVGSVVSWVINYHAFFDLEIHSQLEKVGSAKTVNHFAAIFDVVRKHLGGVETVAKLALRCHAVLETPVEGFEILVFSCQLCVFLLQVGNRIA